MVTLFVGSEERAFHIHKKLVCDKVPAFAAMFNGGFKEAEEGKAKLPEDSPVAFELFVEWLYRGYLSPMHIDATMDRAFIRVLTRSTVTKWTNVFCFAEKYWIEALMDHSLTLIKSAHKEQKMYYGCAAMGDSYEKTREGSRLRRYILRTLCYIMLEKNDSEAWPTTDIQNLLQGSPDLADDFIEAIRGQRKAQTMKPHQFPHCDYHQHKSDEVCPYLTQSIEVMVDSDAHRSKKRKIGQATAAPATGSSSKPEVIEIL